MLDVKRHPNSVSHDDQQAISTQRDLFDLDQVERQHVTAGQDQSARRDGKLSSEAWPQGLTGPRHPALEERRGSNGDQPFVMVQECSKALVGLQLLGGLGPIARSGSGRRGFVLGSPSDDLRSVAQCRRVGLEFNGIGRRVFGETVIWPALVHTTDSTPRSDRSEWVEVRIATRVPRYVSASRRRRQSAAAAFAQLAPSPAEVRTR